MWKKELSLAGVGDTALAEATHRRLQHWNIPVFTKALAKGFKKKKVVVACNWGQDILWAPEKMGEVTLFRS